MTTRYVLQIMKSKIEIETEFKRLIEEKDSQGVWDFCSLYPTELTQEETIAYHNQLLMLDWHHCHDQIVSSYQWMSNPITVEILFQTALNDKIDRLDYKPIARKCTWALADIGTVESKQKLEQLARCGDSQIEEFSKKRLMNWGKEKYRKGLKRRLIKGNSYLYLSYYKNLKSTIENSGQQIVTGQQSENNIIVYQAFNDQIANYAVENQKFGGSNYSFNRMTWIKPNFLWMMYRSGWATKPNQQRILAISISKEFFKKLLHEGELTSIKQSNYNEESIWRSLLNNSEVRIQWDPHHRPDKSKLDRKAIQIGIKGSLQRQFAINEINFIEDITSFVKEQNKYITRKYYKYLKVPIETKMEIEDDKINKKLSIKD